MKGLCLSAWLPRAPEKRRGSVPRGRSEGRVAPHPPPTPCGKERCREAELCLSWKSGNSLLTLLGLPIQSRWLCRQVEALRCGTPRSQEPRCPPCSVSRKSSAPGLCKPTVKSGSRSGKGLESQGRPGMLTILLFLASLALCSQGPNMHPVGSGLWAWTEQGSAASAPPALRLALISWPQAWTQRVAEP